MPSHDPELIFGFATELKNWHLLHITEGVVSNSDFEAYLFRVTKHGSRFAKRLIEGSM